MDVFIKGKGQVSLSQADFVAQGGEGAVYAKGGLAFKVYACPQSMIPTAKIQELSCLTLPAIICPQDVLLDGSNRPVGYTMQHVKNAYALCQLCTRGFRERQGVTPDGILTLVRKFQEGVAYVHQKGMLIVDLHEMNFLVDSAFQNILFIDVDSWQTPGFPATVIMDAIRDRHTSGFNENTDWFSFALVSFQMFIGIHPYKGKHPTLPDLDSRMCANISVLNAEVSIPKVCYPLDVIPKGYLDWYRAVFENGKRCAPPSDVQAVAILTPQVKRLVNSDRLLIKEWHRFPGEIVAPIFCGNAPAALTTDGLTIGATTRSVRPDAKIGFTPRLNHVIAASIEQQKVALYDVTQNRRLNADLAGSALTSANGTLYVRNGSGLYMLEFLEFPAGIQAALKPVGNVLENATQCFEGVVVQSLLGAWHASLLPKPGTCVQVRLQELDGHQIVDAKFDNNVLMLVGVRDGKYHKFIFRFASDYKTHDTRIVSDIAYAGLNFITLDNGLCLHLNENEELELFSHTKDSPKLNIIADPNLQGARLFNNGTQVFFARGSVLYRMTMKTE